MLMNLRDILGTAREHHFAVPAFNIGTGMILNGVMECCEELKAPVILAIHPLELEFMGDHFVKSCVELAHRARVPAAVHLDHGSSMEQMVRAIRCGFTSVMIDASRLPIEENIALTSQVVEMMHPLGISVEGELGTIGTTGNGESGTDTIIYTRPEDAEQFISSTNVDALAIAIGTAHGIYPKDKKPELKLKLLTEIEKKVDIPLVLHGGSSNKDEEIAEAVRRGISKVNIASDIKEAFYRRLRVRLKEDEEVREPFELYRESIESMKQVVEAKAELFGAVDKAKYYHL